MILLIVLILVTASFIPMQLAYSSTIEIPTYSDKQPITGPNGTTLINVDNNETGTVSIAFVNGSALIDIEQYNTCVDKDYQQNLQIKREMNINTLDPYWIDILNDEKMIMMQNCIYLNSANQQPP